MPPDRVSQPAAAAGHLQPAHVSSVVGWVGEVVLSAAAADRFPPSPTTSVPSHSTTAEVFSAQLFSPLLPQQKRVNECPRNAADHSSVGSSRRGASSQSASFGVLADY
jgi:hypothetical protein